MFEHNEIFTGALFLFVLAINYGQKFGLFLQFIMVVWAAVWYLAGKSSIEDNRKTTEGDRSE